ncbi:DJ-1/PfpI family protein [Candidatus Peregrinibacteria bacterium]|nr:DJ-1/PfpI family protein [Candidatus Peregrinibacteria bacterium]
MKKALVIIAPSGYQDLEYAGTRKGLEEADFDIVIGSVHIGSCQGKLGGSVEATAALKDIDVAHYDRIAFIGGPGAKVLDTNPDALRIARETVAAGKPLGAICIAPRILAAAGVLKGVRATVWNADREQGNFLEDHGAIYTGDHVTTDGKIVTADGPPAAEEFGKTLALL